MKPTPAKMVFPYRACAAIVLTVFLVAAASVPLLAKSTTWTHGSATNDLWSNHDNWSNGVPEDNDIVFFSAIEGISVLDISVALDSLDMTGYIGELDARGATLSVSRGAVMSGQCSFLNGSLAVGGDLKIGYYLSGGTISVSGNLSVPYGGQLIGGLFEIGGNITGSPGSALSYITLRVGGDAMLTDFSGVYCYGLTCTANVPLQTIVLDQSKTFIHSVIVNHAAAGNRTLLQMQSDSLTIPDSLKVVMGTLEIGAGHLIVESGAVIEPAGRLEALDGGGDIAFIMDSLVVRGTLSYRKSGGAMYFREYRDPYLCDGNFVYITNGGVFEVIGSPSGRAYIGLSSDENCYYTSRWQLIYDGTSTIHVDYAEIHHSRAKGPALPVVAATNSIDGGDNLNWYFGTVSDTEPPSLRLALEAAPNPFNPSTTLRYELPLAGDVSIRVYDAAGLLVRTLVSEYREAGRYHTSWDGRNDAGRRIGSGAYFCRVESNGEAKVQKLLLLR